MFISDAVRPTVEENCQLFEEENLLICYFVKNYIQTKQEPKLANVNTIVINDRNSKIYI